MGRVGDRASDPVVAARRPRARARAAARRVRARAASTARRSSSPSSACPGIGKSRLVAELGQAVADDEEFITWRYGRCLPYGEGVDVLGARGDRQGAGGDPRERRRRAAAREARTRGRGARRPTPTGAGSGRASRPLVGLAPEDVGARRPARRARSPAGGAFLEALARAAAAGASCSTTCSGRTTACSTSSTSSLDLRRGRAAARRLLRTARAARAATRAGAEASATRSPCRSLRCRPARRRSSSSRSSGATPADARAPRDGRRALARATRSTPRSSSACRPRAVRPSPSCPTPCSDRRRAGRPAAAGREGAAARRRGDGQRRLVGRRSRSSRRVEAEEVDELLRSLGRKEFLRRERQSAVAGATQHAFVHGLVRDAVYAPAPAPGSRRPPRPRRAVDRVAPGRPRARTAPSCSPTTTSRRSSSRGARASTRPSSRRRARRRCARRGCRAFARRRLPGARSRAAGRRELRPDGPRRAGAARRSARHSCSPSRAAGRSCGVRSSSASARAKGGGGRRRASTSRIRFWQQGDGRRRRGWTARALELVEGEPPSRARCARPRPGRRGSRCSRARRSGGRARRTGRSSWRDVDRRRGGCGVALSSPRRRRSANAGDYETCGRTSKRPRSWRLRARPVGGRPRLRQPRSSILLDLGDLDGAIAVAREGLAHDERTGTAGGSGGFASGNLCEACFFAGDWDEAAATSIAELERAERVGGPLLRAAVPTRPRRARRSSATAAPTRRWRPRGARSSSATRADRRPGRVPRVLARRPGRSCGPGSTTRRGSLLDELLADAGRPPSALRRAAGWSRSRSRSSDSGAQAALLAAARRAPRARGSLSAALAIDAGDAAARRRTIAARDRCAALSRPRCCVLAARDALAGRRRRAEAASLDARELLSRARRDAHACGSSPSESQRAAASEARRAVAPRASHSVHPAVDDGARVEAPRAQDARGDRRARPGLADRHERPVVGRSGQHAAHQPVRHVPAAGDVALVALVRARARRRRSRLPRSGLRARRASTGSIVSGPAPSTYPAMSRNATDRRPRDRPLRLVGVGGEDARRALAASSTKPALVEKLEPETGTLTAPGRCPARCVRDGADVEQLRSARAARRAPAPAGCAPRNGPRFSSTIRARFGGFGAETAADSATNASTLRERKHRVEAALEADRRRRLRAHRLRRRASPAT